MSREFKHRKGFLVFAQNNKSSNYVRMAYALAMSLKATQHEVRHLAIAVTSKNDVPEEMAWAFDEIIEIPWHDDSRYDEWKLKNEWKAFHITPYYETIKLDADMLFFSDISDWWSLLDQNDVCICKDVRTYKGDIANTHYYRKTFIYNQIYSAYSAFTYFKANYEGYKFFRLIQYLFRHWNDIGYQYFRISPQVKPTTDVVFGLATTMLGKENIYCPKTDIPTFVHMKTMCQGWYSKQAKDDEWIKYVPHHFTPDLELYINNYKQTLPVHYHAKTFLSDDIIKKYENVVKQ